MNVDKEQAKKELSEKAQKERTKALIKGFILAAIVVVVGTVIGTVTTINAITTIAMSVGCVALLVIAVSGFKKAGDEYKRGLKELEEK